MSENQATTAPVRRIPGLREMGDMQRLAHRQVAGLDVYHHIMAASWPAFFAMLAAAYVALILFLGFFISSCPEVLLTPDLAQSPTYFSSAYMPWLRKVTVTCMRQRSTRISLGQAR